MRPLTLEITGFRSWDEIEIDFSDRGVLVVLGDTGAGKSSILDAIAFALYSRTPEESRSGRLLRSGADHGEVRLTFSAGDRVFRATRRLGSGAPEPAHLLEEIRGGEADRVVTGDAAVSAAIGEATGMGFAAFSSAILLAQGRFAEFLVAPPRRRDDVLREVFEVIPLEGAREAAAQAAARHEGEAALLEQRAQTTPDAGGRLIAASRRARQSSAELAAVRLALPRLERADEIREASREQERRADELEAAISRVPSPAERTRIDAAHDAARRGAEAAEAVLVGAQAEVEAAMAALGTGRARLGGDGVGLASLAEIARAFEAARDRLPDLERAIEAGTTELEAASTAEAAAAKALAGVESRARDHIAHRKAVEAKSEKKAALAAAKARATSAAGVETKAGEVLARAESARDAAEKALDDVRAAHAAAHLRDALSPGDDCPVCGGVVGIVEGLQGPDQAAAEQAVVAAREAVGVAEREAAGAVAAARAAMDERDAAKAALAVAVAASKEAPSGSAIGVEDLEAAQRTQSAAVAESARAEGALASRREDLARALKEQSARRERLGSRADSEDPVLHLLAAADEMAALEERGHLAGAALQTAVATAETARSQARTIADGERAGLTAALTEVERLLSTSADGSDPLDTARRLAAECRSDAERGRCNANDLVETTGEIKGITDPGRRAGVLDVARGAAAEATEGFRAVAAELRAAQQAAADANAARTAAGWHHQVAEDLKANRFPRFVLERHRRRLAERASAWLAELTDGGLAFAAAEPDPLAIVDQRLGEDPRPASSLSGGERFLASLALALGLGEVAGEGAGRPDCLFLDEGFAALDADALDQALTAVERVAADGRLVVVITHLAGVAERLGDALHVTKGPDGISRLSAQDEPILTSGGLLRAT